jgi:deoxyribonuclease-4
VHPNGSSAGSSNDASRKASIEAMVDELSRCEALGVEAFVFHPGAHMNKSARRQSEPQAPVRGLGPSLALRVRNDSEAMLAGIERIARSLDEVHGRCPGFRTLILLEGTAGQGTSIGWRSEQLRAILERVREHERLGVCLDTCHLFAAGYDVRTPQGYAATIDELDSVIGLARVKCIHMNDSKCPLGSRVDRHEHIGKGLIGKGLIGKSGFANFLNDPRFAGIPMILETPKGVDGRGTDFDRVNLRRLRTLIA